MILLGNSFGIRFSVLCCVFEGLAYGEIGGHGGLYDSRVAATES